MAEGISFLVRIRNEEQTLKESILSLANLTIPHEIILILHLCSDRSLEIANELKDKNTNIKIFTYDTEISRAGYAHLCTDASSKHSLVTYYNWCLSKSTMAWKFKWDADFVASPELIEYLNKGNWAKQKKMIRLNAKYEDMEHKEYYLSSCLLGYIKYIFCENICSEVGNEKENIDLVINHVSKPSEIKSYWHKKPWYETEDSDETKILRERMAKLVEEFGEEPVGLFRYGKTRAARDLLIKIEAARPPYVSFYT